MKNDKLMAGAAALTLGSLLIIGVGCKPASSAPERTEATSGPRTGAAPSESIAPDSADAREITVTATNFAFSPSEIRVTKGEKIKLTLVNRGGTHGIGIPAFNVSLRPGPGGTASAVFIADQAGSFPFFCNVFCGEGHRDMHGTLIVE